MKSEYDHHLSRCEEECIFSFFAPSSFIRNLLYSFHLVYLILSKIVSKTYIFFFLLEIKSHRHRLYVELRKLEKKRVICWLVESLNLVFYKKNFYLPRKTTNSNLFSGDRTRFFQQFASLRNCKFDEGTRVVDIYIE